MTSDAKRTAGWVGGIIIVAISLASFLGLSPRVLSQPDRNAADIDRNGRALGDEINRATMADAELSRRISILETLVTEQNREILRRLDRIERKVTP